MPDQNPPESPPKRGRGRQPGERALHKWLREFADSEFFLPSGPPPRPKSQRPTLRNQWHSMNAEERSAFSAKLSAGRTNHRLKKAEKEALGLPAQGNKWFVPRGWRVSEYEAVMTLKAPIIKRIMKQMDIEGYIPEFELPEDDKLARAALRTNLEIMVGPGHTVKDKLKASENILKYTKQKPTEKHEHTMSAAEAFLLSLAKKDDDSSK